MDKPKVEFKCGCLFVFGKSIVKIKSCKLHHGLGYLKVIERIWEEERNEDRD